jgi:CRP-like cAMP-binding protein
VTQTQSATTYRAFLKQQAEFRAFETQEFDQLTTHLQVKQYAKGQILFDQGDRRDRFYYVIKGVIRLERVDASGSFSFINYVKAQKAFPYRGLDLDPDYPYTAMALTPITIAVFDMADFETVVAENRAVSQQVIRQMSQLIERTETRLQRMVTSSAARRVQQALLILGTDLGQPINETEIEIPYPMTLIELAHISGTTRETAGQVVNKLVAAGTISYQRKRFRFSPSVLGALTK